MSRGVDERERTISDRPAPTPARERTEREWDENRRAEAAGDITAARLLAQPSAPEMRMWSVLAALQEQYQSDYVREFKVAADDGWYCGHVDYAWPDKRLVIEVYGGPHYKPALDKKGTRQEDDARRIAEIGAAGWAVMIVRDTELTRHRWAAMVQRCRVFLDTGRDPGPPSGRSRR